MVKSYPRFSPNQVLTDAHLNEVVEYLDREDRVSRTRLLGVGIVCGLEPRSDLRERVVVGRGCGVTTQGELLVVEEDTAFTHRREYTDAGQYFTGARKLDFPLWELVETPQAPTPGVTRIGDAPDFLRERVAVLYLERQEKDLRSCVENDCNEKGRRRYLTPRLLVVARQDALKLALSEDVTFTPPAPPVTLRVPRPGFSDREYPFGKLNYADVVSAFTASVVEVVRPLSEALEKSIERLQPALGTVALSETVAGRLRAAQQMFLKDGRGVQYLYDWVKELSAAYAELAEVAARMGSRCCPDEDLFAQHLLLGELEDNLAASYRPARVPRPPGRHRHPFLPSPAVGNQAELRERAACLLQRLILQVEKFSWAPGSRIAITPDAGPRAPLGERTLPHHYSLAGGSPSLLDHWSYDLTRFGWQDTMLSYSAEHYSRRGMVVDPLRYEHDGAAFFRIEGHLEQRVDDVLAYLEEQRRAFGLPFQVVAVAFDDAVTQGELDKDCRSADLEAVYDGLREEYRCLLEREKQYFEELTPPPTERGKVKGRITKSADLPEIHDPLRLTVLDTGQTVTADNEGHFELELPEGAYVLQSSAGSWVGDRIFVEVQANLELEQDLNIRQDAASGPMAPSRASPASRPPYRFDVPRKTIKEYIQDFIGQVDPKEAPDRFDLLNLASIWTAAGKAEFVQHIGLPARLALLLGQALTMLPTDLADLDLEKLRRNLTELKKTASTLESKLLSNEPLTPGQIQQLQHLQVIQGLCRVELLATLKQGFDARREAQKRRLFFSAFLDAHPSLEHLGGVPRGGTFVIAYEDGLVKADFALSYTCCDPCGPMLLRVQDSLPPPADLYETLSFVEPNKTLSIPEAVAGNVFVRAIVTDPGDLATLKVEDPGGKLRIEARPALFDRQEYTFEYLVQARGSEKTALGKVFLALINDSPLPKPADIRRRTAEAKAVLIIAPPAAVPVSMVVVSAAVTEEALGVATVEKTGKEIRFQARAGFAQKKRADISYTLRNIESNRTVDGTIVILLEEKLAPIELREVTVKINRLRLVSTAIELPLKDMPDVIVETIDPMSRPELGTLTLNADRGPIYFKPSRSKSPKSSKEEHREKEVELVTYSVRDTVTGAKGTGRIVLDFSSILVDL
ncbi:hypothetical protein [Corallococcus aberystwythensis]|uniref:Carboxypeptidase regulatory-like domain-containing protein n=1 Tax=Corallococcus aberystwythensis TaxID=2316722 RepID=A0A3A8QX41_9BACT|nr:hypothetical protein [Corallococcus aberystwythensis]RKH69412.1 hypothetical protein D7W81_11110 [Corallococcus aberystwythensis]